MLWTTEFEIERRQKIVAVLEVKIRFNGRTKNVLSHNTTLQNLPRWPTYVCVWFTKVTYLFVCDLQPMVKLLSNVSWYLSIKEGNNVLSKE